MRFRWLLLGAVAVGCSLNPQPDLPAPRDGAAPVPDGGTSEGEGTGGTVSSGAASSGGGSINIDMGCQGGAGGECTDELDPPSEGGVPASAGAGTINAKDAGAAGLSAGGDGD